MVAHKWRRIGVMLEIEAGELDKIKLDNTSDCEECLQEMLNLWLKVNPKPSWSTMADALEALGEEALAKHIRTEYCSTRKL